MSIICVSPEFPLNRSMRKAVQRGKLQIVRMRDELSPMGGGGTSRMGRSFRTTRSPLVCMVEREAESGGGLGGSSGEKTVWIVRAGKHGENEGFALANNCVVVDWPRMGDFSKYQDKNAIGSMLKSARGETNVYRIGSHAGQIWTFAQEMKIGELVVLPLKTQIGKVAVGKIIEAYKFHPDGEPGTEHRRKVEWLNSDVARCDFDADIRASLGSLLTVSRVRRSQATERILNILEHNTSGLTGRGENQVSENDDVIEESIDPEDAARNLIYDHIQQKFTGHGMADLVEEILRALGLQCKKSPQGPDGGVDILAAGGELGFGSPLLCVQVKGRRDKAGDKDIKYLADAMRKVRAEKGLFVSWSGFKGLSGDDIRRQFFSIRFWEADDLVRLIERHYDKFSDDFKERLPLKKIWVLNTDN